MRYTRYFDSWKFNTMAHYMFGNIAINNLHQNFGYMFKWRSMEEGFNEAKIVKKPIFFLIHKIGCPTCEKLKSQFAKSLRIHDLSQYFVMVNARKGEMKNEARFEPDGTYVPRILFFTPDGKFMKDIYNRHPDADEKCKYFYNNTAQIVDSMLLAMERYPQI